jgi:hypothetical protein
VRKNFSTFPVDKAQDTTIRALPLIKTVIKSVRIEEDARPKPRQWRALDIGIAKCYLEYNAVRVRCPGHGVRVDAVPWAQALAAQDQGVAGGVNNVLTE